MVRYIEDENNYMKFRNTAYMTGTMILEIC